MKNPPKTDDLIALICKAASEKYREDRIRPGIQIAHIPEGPDPKVLAFGIAGGMSAESVAESVTSEPASWYVALHRYPNGQQRPGVECGAMPSRVIVHKARHDDLDRAVQLLALQLLPVEAQAELAAAIKGLT